MCMTQAEQRKCVLDLLSEGNVYDYKQISEYMIEICKKRYNGCMQMSIPSILDELVARREIIGNRRLGYQRVH